MFRVVRWLPAILVSAMTLATGVASAQEPNLISYGNRWTITAFNDESPIHDEWATQGICFRSLGTFGTHQRYEWWSDTFPDWNGIATQEGDQIEMHGDYAGDVGHDGMSWQIASASPRNIGTGHWFEWREDGKFGRTIGFANAVLTRVGRCRLTLEEAKLIPPPVDFTGKEIESPFGNLGLQPLPTK
jgi:hypothetical protein